MKRMLVALSAILVLAALLWLALDSAGPENESGTASPEAMDEEAPEPPAADADPEPATTSGNHREEDTAKALKRMRDARDCLEKSDCVLGDPADPRAEHFEAGKRVAAGMAELIEAHKAGALRDAELARIAREFLAFDSGRGRAAALRALNRVPPGSQNLDAITSALDQHHDEALFELALEQFPRYVDAGYGREIDDFLLSNLRNGARYPARTIAEHLDTFITPENKHRYRDLAAELPEDSWRAELLQQALGKTNPEYENRGHP